MGGRRTCSVLLALLLGTVSLIGGTLIPRAIAAAPTVPVGFQQQQVVSGLSSPTAMAFAPDGRIFVTEQGGHVRVIKNNQLLLTPFAKLNVSTGGERGLLGITFDPAFTTNPYVYVYYTTASSPVHNRVSRLTAQGDVAVAGSETAILDLDNLSSAMIHNGGALHFGSDGLLYVATGDNGTGSNAQSFSNRLGKILRIRRDGSIPTSNPTFNGKTTGLNRAIWAMGLRNPFTFAFQRGTTRMFINDVGELKWEEINDGIAGSNYGWPVTEGPTSDPRFRSPLYAYGHGDTNNDGCAITGGAFYNPATVQFPSGYVGKYFFADFCRNWVHRYDPVNGAISDFATGMVNTVDLHVTDDGSLYLLSRGLGGGSVIRVTHTGNKAPTIGTQPSDQLVSDDDSATFTVEANGAPTLSYQWRRNGVEIPGATSATYTFANAKLTDHGTRFRVKVTNAFGFADSREATLSVTADEPPMTSITQPLQGTTYAGGQTIQYAGSASDPETGVMPAEKFTWKVDFHHADHVHPFIQPVSGSKSGQFTVPNTGHTEANVWLRIHLTLTDEAGLTTTVFRDVQPRKVSLTLNTVPAGLSLILDDQPRATPLTLTGVVGVQRTLSAPRVQTLGNKQYEFVNWSDGGAASHTVTTPTTNTTYTATYKEIGTGLTGTYYNNADFTGSTVKRIDSTVDFNWGVGAPAPGIGADTFSVRWVGAVLPPTSGVYTFFTQSDEGVRLWVNGKQLVNNWSSHTLAENFGSIVLTGGVRYAVRMEYYDNVGAAVSRLLWQGPAITKAVVPSRVLFAPYTAKINFQPSASTVPAGYLPDFGNVFGLRGNGDRYGWLLSNAAQMRDRNAARSPDQRYDTLALMQAAANPNASWEVVVPNGAYTVRVVAGDPTQTNSSFRLNVEGVTVVSGTPNASKHWIEGTAVVSVSDNRLTVTNGVGAVNNKICFIDIG